MAMLILNSRFVERAAFGVMLLFNIKLVDMSFLWDATYRGSDRGINVGVNDILVLSLLIFMILSPRWKKIEWFPKNGVLLALFFLYCAGTIYVAYVKLYVVFSLSVFVRAYLYYIVVVNYIQTRDDIEFFMRVMVIIALLQTVVSLFLRYYFGAYRLLGTFAHYNDMGQYLNMIIPVFLVLIMATNSKYNKWYFIGLLGAILCVIGSLSRGSIAVLGVLLAGTVLLSMYQSITPHKVRLLILFIFAFLAISFKAMDTLIERFTTAAPESGEARQTFNAAAIAMANDNFYGVGLNNYFYAFRNTDYARFADYEERNMGNVHNIYLMFAAETGWLGMVFFIFIIARFNWFAFKMALRRRQTFENSLAVGLTMSLLGIIAQGLLEPGLRFVHLLLHYASFAGLTVALIDIEKRKRLAPKRPDTSAADRARVIAATELLRQQEERNPSRP